MAKETATKKYSGILIRPRVTEKAALLSEKGAYTFEVVPEANKRNVMQAVKETYGIDPVKVNIARGVTKNVTRKGRSGTRSGNKRAIVYVKKGDKIEFI